MGSKPGTAIPIFNPSETWTLRTTGYDPGMPPRRPFSAFWRRLLEAVLGAVIVVSALLVFDHAARRLDSKGGEWQYIYASRYFANLFTAGGPANPEWADGYWTHDQPMISHYVLGAWLSARGYDVYQMPDPWSLYTAGLGKFVIGPVPDGALLGEARALMVFLAAGGRFSFTWLGVPSADP